MLLLIPIFFILFATATTSNTIDATPRQLSISTPADLLTRSLFHDKRQGCQGSRFENSYCCSSSTYCFDGEICCDNGFCCPSGSTCLESTYQCSGIGAGFGTGTAISPSSTSTSLVALVNGTSGRNSTTARTSGTSAGSGPSKSSVAVYTGGASHASSKVWETVMIAMIVCMDVTSGLNAIFL